MQRSDYVDPPKAHAAHVQTTNREASSRAHAARLSAPLRFSMIGGGVLVALLALLAGYGLLHNDRVFRGVQVLGAELGGLSKAEALAAIESAGKGYPSDALTLDGAGRVWTMTPADLGVAVDADKTFEAAMQVGRAEGFLGSLGAQFSALFGGTQVAPVLKYDAKKVDQAIATVAASVDRQAVDSKLERGADGAVIVTPSSTGSLVDREALRASLVGAVAAAPFAPVEVAMKEQAPKMTEAGLQGALTHALLLTDRPLTLVSGEQSWTLEPAQLREMLDMSPNAAGVDVTLSNDKVAAYLGSLAPEIFVEPTDAAVVIGKGTVTLEADVAGSELDVQAAVPALLKAAEGADEASRTLELPLKARPAALKTADVQAIYDKANALVTEGIRVRFRDDGYILRDASVTGFIDVERAEGGLELVVDEAVLKQRIAGVAWNINRNATDARFRMVNGTPTKVADAREGFKVDTAISTENVLNAIDGYKGGERLQVDLDVAVTAPTVVDADLSTVHTPDLLGSGQTSYAGSSAERAWNVGLGTRRVDGALIPPGGTFSTVDTIGDLTLAAGFKMGYAIVNTGRGVTTIPSEAGGICQVSTTLFHSVFWAGMPIVERNWHSYWIGTYGRPPSGLLGLDATIAPPEKDFRFKNSTNGWLLVRATADGKTVNFQLFGINQGWNVGVSGPVITNRVATSQAPVTETSSALPAGKKVMVEHAQDGFNSSIRRVVRDANGNVIDDWTAKSRYVPARNRYLVGTAR